MDSKIITDLISARDYLKHSIPFYPENLIHCKSIDNAVSELINQYERRVVWGRIKPKTTYKEPKRSYTGKPVRVR